jgi:hypothetical protein
LKSWGRVQPEFFKNRVIQVRMSKAGQNRNPMIGSAPEDAPSGNPPSTPFDKGGLGGSPRGVAQRKFSLQNEKCLIIGRTENRDE